MASHTIGVLTTMNAPLTPLTIFRDAATTIVHVCTTFEYGVLSIYEAIDLTAVQDLLEACPKSPSQHTIPPRRTVCITRRRYAAPCQNSLHTPPMVASDVSKAMA